MPRFPFMDWYSRNPAPRIALFTSLIMLEMVRSRHSVTANLLGKFFNVMSLRESQSPTQSTVSHHAYREQKLGGRARSGIESRTKDKRRCKLLRV